VWRLGPRPRLQNGPELKGLGTPWNPGKAEVGGVSPVAEHACGGAFDAHQQ
jgi:hypothetical protein